MIINIKPFFLDLGDVEMVFSSRQSFCLLSVLVLLALGSFLFIIYLIFSYIYEILKK